MDQAFTF